MSTLLVASSGGHLTQLHQLRPRLSGLDEHVVWVTFDTPQSRSLLAGEHVRFIEHTVTRDYRAIVANVRPAARLMRDEDATGVVSTGAGIALSFLPLARARGLECHYIESATRATAPSATGRILAAIPGVSLYTQHRALAGRRWKFAGSVFDRYEPRETAATGLQRMVVTLGAHEVYGFRLLVERLVDILPPDVEILWQTGSTDVSGLGIEARPFVPAAELAAALREADVVVTHAGIGSVLSALEAGRCPVVVPRDAQRGEHVDDHQREAAAALSTLDLAVVREADELTLSDFELAMHRHVLRRASAPPFVLRSRRR